MQLKTLNQNELDSFVAAQPNSQLLQSYNWSQFQKLTGHQAWNFGVFENDKLIASVSLISHQLPLNKGYLYCPRGPVFDESLADDKKGEALKIILGKARDLTIQTKQSEEIFFRLEPIFEFTNSKIAPSEVEGPKIIKSTPIQPKDTLLLNLDEPVEKLLSNMHQKTRYNIKVAQKHNIKIKQSDDFNKVWPVFQKTSQRDKFSLHPKKYYLKMLKTVPEIKLFCAFKDNAIIAGNLVSAFGDTVTYLHGASDYNYRNLMAPNLLQWEVIKQAKDQSFKYYDFHGVAPDDDKNHPWYGITRFKKGFGGNVKNYPGTFDFIYESGWYKIYKVFRKLNRLRR